MAVKEASEDSDVRSLQKTIPNPRTASKKRRRDEDDVPVRSTKKPRVIEIDSTDSETNPNPNTPLQQNRSQIIESSLAFESSGSTPSIDPFTDPENHSLFVGSTSFIYSEWVAK
jgi:hypothetical protein